MLGIINSYSGIILTTKMCIFIHGLGGVGNNFDLVALIIFVCLSGFVSC